MENKKKARGRNVEKEIRDEKRQKHSENEFIS